VTVAHPHPWSPPTIEDHALIGDGRASALVTTDGTLDWLCLSRPEGPPYFGALIGGERGGRFAIRPLDAGPARRRYREGSAILETTWTTRSGVARLTEGMVLDISRRLLPQALVVRRLEAVEGEVRAEVLFDPRRDLAEPPTRVAGRAGALIVEWGSTALLLCTDPGLELAPGRTAEVTVRPGRPATFSLAVADRAPGVLLSASAAWSAVEECDAWWRSWTDGLDWTGPQPDPVIRSLITLRLLTFTPSGAPVAAPTTSLPEEVGGERNWDYRFAWPRDASLGISAFLGAGRDQEALAFLRWLTVASRLSRPRVQVLYDVLGRPGVNEVERTDVPGYRDSHPVRMGNAACGQHQLDVYGWVVEAGWHLAQHGPGLDRHLWSAVQHWADFVCGCWRHPDAGLWEGRGEPTHHVHSKLMGWRALDRALGLTRGHRARGRRVARWERERRALADDIRTRGVDPVRGVYVRRYGSSELDAALLMLPSIGFEPPDAPRVRATVDAIRSELDAGGGLLYRYPPGSDGLSGGEGAFLACSFWLVTALCRLGRVDEAGELFDSLCGRANDVGLFGEEIDPATGAHLGNFPQALTHSSLVEAALALRAATEDGAAARG
jgi:GH15 family glucan-1,4-alpha-glucosidase